MGRDVTGLELILLIFLVVLVVVMLMRDVQTKNRLDQLEAELAGLNSALDNTIRVHQARMDDHSGQISELAGVVEKLGKRAFLTGVTITPLDEEGKPSGPPHRF